MTDYRSDAERFVTEFLDYANDTDNLNDFFDKRNQRMIRSPGMEALIKQAKSVFPERVGQAGNEKLTQEERIDAIEASANVLDTREMFSRRVQLNGGVRRLLEDLYKNEPGAHAAVAEFLAAEDGTKEFHVPAKV